MRVNEMRIDRFSFNLTKDYKDFQSFSIGHESCIIKFFKIFQNNEYRRFLQTQKDEGKEIRILTPFVPQCYLENMKKVLSCELSNPLFHESMIIVNDLGMMKYIHEIDPERKICLGRSLLFSFDFTPWGELIYYNETIDIQTIIKQVNLLDDIKIKFFKGFNVVAVESNITNNTFPSLQKLKEYGTDVYVNESFYLYGVQRSCYVRRYSFDNQCNYDECDAQKKITLASQWEASESFLNETTDFFPAVLFLRGNQICGNRRYKAEHPFNCVFSE